MSYAEDQTIKNARFNVWKLVREMNAEEQTFLLPMFDLLANSTHWNINDPSNRDLKERMGVYCDYLKENGRLIEAYWWETTDYGFVNFLSNLKHNWRAGY